MDALFRFILVLKERNILDAKLVEFAKNNNVDISNCNDSTELYSTISSACKSADLDIKFREFLKTYN
jgi:hypothetical protein